MIKEIFIGSSPNDKTGTPARQAGQIINDNFAYLDEKLNNKDRWLIIGTFVLSGQQLILHAGWVGEINGQEFSNPEDVVLDFPFSPEGKFRIDKVVFNTSNTFSVVRGVESVNNPIASPLPADNLEFGITLVSDNEVGDVNIPGDIYEKLDKGGYVGTAQTLKNEIEASKSGSIDFKRLTVNTQDFEMPAGKTAKWALVNFGIWVKATANNTDEENTFTQSGTTVRFKTPREFNEYVIIFY